MPRTTATAVKNIVEVSPSPDKDDDELLAPFIETASLLVENLLAGKGNTDEHLELIERWLSAHFYKIYDPMVMSETVGPISTSYLFKTGDALDGTTFGQTALALDTSGKLSRYNRGIKTGMLGTNVGIKWVGGGITA